MASIADMANTTEQAHRDSDGDLTATVMAQLGVTGQAKDTGELKPLSSDAALYEEDTSSDPTFTESSLASLRDLFANSSNVIAYVLIGLTLLAILLFGVKLIRSRMRTARSRRRVAVRTSGVRSQRDLVELRHLEQAGEDEEEAMDDDDDVTLFSSSKPSSGHAMRINMKGNTKRK